MEDFDSIENLAKAIKNKLNPGLIDRLKGVVGKHENKILALYAFNSTGKTRLSNEFNKLNEDGDQKYRVLCYNALLEDLFVWDNENYIINFDKKSWIIKLVIDQGLENNIAKDFKDITNSKLEPLFDFAEGKVSFSVASGDEQYGSNVKISRGEESVLIWCVFHSVLEMIIDNLNAKETDRSTSEFNDLMYIIIDDPVSSIDDTKIIPITLKIVDTIRSCKNINIKFLITTHHALFYNVFINSFKKEKYKGTFDSYSLSKISQNLRLVRQDDSPFSYHLSIKEVIDEAIKNDTIERYHFNLFRNILEKTSIFLGYNKWSDCILKEDNKEFVRILNLYSHSKISDLESREISTQDRDLFIDAFGAFIKDFKWKQKHE